MMYTLQINDMERRMQLVNNCLGQTTDISSIAYISVLYQEKCLCYVFL